MRIFKRILTAVDGSENSLEACSAAGRLARAAGATVEVVEVVPRNPTSEDRAEATKVIRKARALASRAGVRASGATIEVRESVVETVVSRATASRSDLVVVGAKGTGGFKQLLLGSVSGGVVTHARGSVLVVRSLESFEGQLFRKVLGAVDGSEESMRAAGTAANLARLVGAKLTLLHVICIPAAAYSSGLEATSSIEKKARSSAEECLSAARGAAEERGVDARIRIVEDLRSPVRGITEYASENGVDLIVMGTRGLGGFKRLLLGSVASGVVSYASCSVLVVRDGRGA